MPKIIVLDDLSQEGLGLLRSAPGLTAEVRTGLKGDDLRLRCGRPTAPFAAAA